MIGEPRTVALSCVGCKVNQCEVEDMARRFAEAGFHVVEPDSPADVFVINTCTVTHVADRKSRQLIRRAIRANPEALVVVTGCYAEVAQENVCAIEGVDLVVGTADKGGVVDTVTHLYEEALAHEVVSSQANDTRPLSHGTRTRALVKVQDGCDHFCSYCIVPFARGRQRSIPLAQVVKEVQQRVAEGFVEVVLTGVHIGAYGREDGTSLAHLVGTLLRQTDVTRLRLSSIEPEDFDEELLALWRNSRLCRHIHLPMQSGSDAVLRAMNRGYDSERYRWILRQVREAIPGLALTTDIIVGFPGESEAHFAETLALVQEAAFARLHVFQFSPRTGTRAARMGNQVPIEERGRRSEFLLGLSEEAEKGFHRRFIGRTVEVLWESEKNGLWHGLTDNYLQVYVRSSQDLANTLRPARVTEAYGDGLLGELLPVSLPAGR